MIQCLDWSQLGSFLLCVTCAELTSSTALNWWPDQAGSSRKAFLRCRTPWLSSMWPLHVTSLGFITTWSCYIDSLFTWQLVSRGKGKVAQPFEVQAWNWRHITSADFQWSKQFRTSARILGLWPPPLDRWKTHMYAGREGTHNRRLRRLSLRTKRLGVWN